MFASTRPLPKQEAVPPPEVVVAMSGGVDSSVAAAILRDSGCSVMGLTLRLSDLPEDSGEASGDRIFDARRVADALSIPHELIDSRSDFLREVIRPFAREYAAGRTPNPCVRCNEKIKFGSLLALAREMGAGRLATGHYARVEPLPGGGHALLRARDLSKDQSYFLYRLGQEELSQLVFPLGELEKSEVRARARALGICTAEAAESQEICFVPKGRYDRVVDAHLCSVPPKGEIVHVDGRILGEHDGVHRYTVGQRRGLRIPSSERLYVVSIEASKGKLTLGPIERLERRSLRLSSTRWALGEAPGERPLTVRVRYRHAGVRGRITRADGSSATILLEEPVRAAAPGQAVVLYDGEMVVGGGTLEEAL